MFRPRKRRSAVHTVETNLLLAVGLANKEQPGCEYGMMIGAVITNVADTSLVVPLYLYADRESFLFEMREAHAS